MKKTYINKIAMPVLLAITLSGSMSNVWSMEAARAAKAAKIAEKEAPEKTPEKIAEETARKEAEAAKKKMASTQEKQRAAEKEQEEAQKQLKAIQTDEATRKAIDAARTVEDLEKLLEKQPEEAQKKAIEKAIELKKIVEAQQVRTDELKKRMAETTAKLKALEAPKPTTAKTPADLVEAAKAKVTSWKKKLLIGGGVGVGSFAALGLILGEILDMVGEVSEKAAEIKKKVEDDWGIGKKDKDETDSGNGTIIPNILPKADPNDPDYNKTLEDVANLFSNFDQDMKEMLEKNADYSSSVIKFEAGKVDIDGTQVAVSIKYDTEQLDVGLALIPVLITLAPQDLRGFALTPDDILGKMEDGAAKDMLTLVLNPTASFIFTIKLIQLYNTATKDSTKSTTAKIEYMLDEATELYSRFILSRDEDIAPDSLISYLQQYPAIMEVLNNKNVKVYKELADAIDTPLEEQKTAFIDMQNSEIVEGPLSDAMKIFYNQFSQVYFKKFKNDGEYDASSKFTPGIRATKNTLQAIFYRGLKDVIKAGQELSEASGKVTLRKLDGTEYEVDPKADLSNFIAKPSSGIETATNNLKSAISGLKKILDAAKTAKKAVESRDMQSAKAAYTKAIDGVKTASSTASKAILEFRKKLAPFYPLTWDDGTSLTPAEFLIANIKELNDADAANVKTLLNKIYSPFSKHLGLTTAQLLGSTQGKLVDKAADVAKDVAKSVVTKFKSTTAAEDKAKSDDTTADASSSDTAAKPALKAPAKPATKTTAKPSTSTAATGAFA